MTRATSWTTTSTLALLALAAGCAPAPVFPEDYAATYVEVRDCRGSGDHDLHNVRVLADPTAFAAYANRTEPFPVGAIVIKEEYDFGDTDCTGEIIAWTAMEKLEVGADPRNLDWYWQGLDENRAVDEDNPRRCANCHEDCAPPIGYDGTCTVP
ncbi:MAG: cytochrome P460 family protein [Sandaracinaceae bacterium]